ncbi:MAG TPA: polymer-forming cytoskeletal protein [Mucilaginibacter sp.]|nr:polymer-forming cytoskeletal protein [Mucilaginibacter sp.]
MFFRKKKDKVYLSQQVISTLISEGCVFEGNLRAPANVRIEGQIIGDVTIVEGLILGEKGVIKGSVITKELIIYGVVNGHVNTHSLEIKGTGRITGDIKTQVLQVEPGGSHNGRLSMSPAHDNTAIRTMKPENSPVNKDMKPENGAAIKNLKPEISTPNKDIKPENGAANKNLKLEIGTATKDIKPENGAINKSIKVEAVTV